MADSSRTRATPFLSLLVLLVFIITAPQLSTSRPINGFLSSNVLQAVDPNLQIAFPAGDYLQPVIPNSLESDPSMASPCNFVTPKQELAEKFKPLLLNLLPRASTPPSGPSPGIDSNKKN